MERHGDQEQGGATGAGRATGGGLSPGAVWFQALTEDTGCVVVVVDERCRVVFANGEARAGVPTREPGAAADQPGVAVRAALRDLFPMALAAECEVLVRRVFESGAPVAFTGMVRGVWCRCVLRLIVVDDERAPGPWGRVWGRMRTALMDGGAGGVGGGARSAERGPGTRPVLLDHVPERDVLGEGEARGTGGGGERLVVLVGRAAPSVASDGEEPAGGAPGEGMATVRAKAHDLGALSALSYRELEVLRLIGQGKTTEQTAEKLHRSVKTVEWHRASLGAKLGVKNRVDLAAIAIRSGLTRMRDEELRGLAGEGRAIPGTRAGGRRVRKKGKDGG